MTDQQLRPRLERLSERVQTDPSAFEQLGQRRARVKRRRKFSAIGLAVVLSTVGTFGVVTALRENGTPPPVPQESAPPATSPAPCPISDVIHIAGNGERFDTDCLAIVAGRETPFEFRLEGNGIPQSFLICADPDCHKAGAIVGTQIDVGPALLAGTVPALEAGTYYFVDEAHPTTANGTLYAVEEGPADGGPASPPEPAAFVPPTVTENGTTLLPMVLPDGSQVEIAYPEALRLAELGLSPQTLVHSTQSNGCGWEPVIRLGSAGDVLYQGSNPVSPPPEGGPAMWAGKGGSPYYLVYEFGNWTVSVPCDQSDFDGLESWSSGLRGHVTRDGFLVLDTSPPIVQEGANPDLSTGPGFVFGGGSDPGFIVLTLGTHCDSGTEVTRDDDSAQWCAAVGEGAVEIRVQTPQSGSDRFIDSIIAGLEVRAIDINN
jgi:hypothetical protein